MSSYCSSAIRVILADDSELIRRTVRSILKEDPKIQVIGETQTGSNVRMLMALKPDVALVDLHMLDTEMVTALSNSDPKICILVMSALVSAESMEFARQFGINEVLEKCDLGTTLVPAVKSALDVRNNGHSVKVPKPS